MENPYVEKKKQDKRLSKCRFRTMVYELATNDHLCELAKVFTQIANQPSKFMFSLFEKGSTPEGVPFVFTRLVEDPSVKDKVFGQGFAHTVLARRFTAATFDEMDTILNSQGNHAALGEIRFTYKTGEIGSILFWAELGPEARQTEGLNVIRRYLQSNG